ncbi:hypothetical protein F4780DRAFT_631801 [Xylariomycetidae sp. FL0641]|nr:hypothetical protein F4780DRAFT_631801 [Xylariomycetidae sp. FL0641]
MAASRAGQSGLPDLQIPTPSTPAAAASALADQPPISALFLIEFDVKAGYTITWKASRPGIELEGVVEYKSLPSGLHTVSEDLIYFVHDDYAGISAFVNAPVEDSAARNARMLAVGVLVPLSYGRLGRAWKHAEGLKSLASTLAADNKNTAVLEEHWQKHQLRDPTRQDLAVSRDSLESPSTLTFQIPKTHKKSRSHNRIRSASDGNALIPPGHRLSPFHPAWSLHQLLDTFGPLIFPIQRAALLRKRILILGHAPVQEACNFVYDISILSNIPLSTYNMLAPGSPPHRLRPLFCIGVHDIPFLMDESKPRRDSDESGGGDPETGTGWIACTTDSILAKKDTLWDMLITLPAPHAANAKQHVWPTVECPQNTPIKATQRDLRRYRALKAGLARLQAAVNGSPPATPRTPIKLLNEEDVYIDDSDAIVEPLSWTALAYNGFMWWASAGEQTRAEQAEESAHDYSLLAELSAPDMYASGNASTPRSADPLSTSVASLSIPSTAHRRRASGLTISADAAEANVELAIIAYFHRLTTQVLGTLVDIVEDDEGPEETEEEREEEDDALLNQDEQERYVRGVRVGGEAMKRMGLDIWSRADALFVKEALATYFDRRAYVEGKGVEVCGVRVC